MKRSRFSDEQVNYSMRRADQGTLVKGVRRHLAIAEATFYLWRKKHAGLGSVEAQ